MELEACIEKWGSSKKFNITRKTSWYIETYDNVAVNEYA